MLFQSTIFFVIKISLFTFVNQKIDKNCFLQFDIINRERRLMYILKQFFDIFVMKNCFLKHDATFINRIT